MPIYEFSCKNCKSNFEIFANVNQRIKGCCPNCNNVGERVFSLHYFKEFNPYYHIGLGEQITSKKQLNKLLKANNSEQITDREIKLKKEAWMDRAKRKIK